MASTAVVTSDAELAEQQRRLNLIEQERRDREYAERLFQEQFDDTPPESPQPSTSQQPIMQRPPFPQRRFNPRDRTRAPRTSSTTSTTTSNDGGGPIRRGATRGARGARRARATPAGPVRGPRTPIRIRVGPIMRSPRMRLAHNPPPPRGRRGQQQNASSSNVPQGQSNTPIVISDSDDSDFDNSPQVSRPRGNRPAVSADYIHRLLQEELMRDSPRDTNYHPLIIDDDEDDDVSDLENEDEEEDEDSDIRIDDIDDDIMDEIGPLRAERNNITQPIFDEDRSMYNRELDLYHDDDEYQVPPPKPPTKKGGKAVAPDPTWGDCTMCSNTPVKPQGCKKCLQFLGCADCVRRWHGARQSSYDKPNCPLCRAPWNGHTPAVSLMPTIEKHREKQAAKNAKEEATSSGPSTSTSK